MALAGPATSLALGVVFLGVLRASTGHGGFDARFALFYLAELNLFLGLFNLLPAFPMDGGRILRGLLVRSRGPVRATQIAATFGKVFAALFAIGGFVGGNFMLVLIAFFVYIGAEGEQHAVIGKAVLGELRIRDVMSRAPAAVAPDDTVYDVGERMLRERRLSFPVARDGRVLGVVTRDAIEHVPLEQRPRTAASAAMIPVASLPPDARVLDALQLLSGGARALPVVDGDRLVGTISQLDVARGLRLQELATSQHPRDGAAGPPAPPG